MKYELYVEIEGINLFIIGNFHKAEYENGLPDRFEIDVIKSEDDNLYDLLIKSNLSFLRSKYMLSFAFGKNTSAFNFDSSNKT